MSGLQNNNSSVKNDTELKCCFALGDFDGVHLGHRALLEATVNNGLGLVPAVYSFEDNCKGAPLVTTPEEKKKMMLSLGIRVVILDRFEFLKERSPEQFVEEILVNSLDAGAVVCGEDYRFGHNAAGDVNDLKRLCAAVGIPVIVVGEYIIDGKKISSSDVREFIEKGDMRAAARLLGRPFSLTGTVSRGDNIGGKNGIPTVNVPIKTGRVLPPFGVYVSQIVINGAVYNGVSDIGLMPSVHELSSPRIETFVFDFSDQIYGETVEIRLLEFIRSEQVFPDSRSLYEQINIDVAVARDYFNGEKYEKR